MKRIYVFDNGGETLDRYTILDTKTGDYYGASENPFHPQGFGQYAGNTCTDYWLNAYGVGWRNGCKKLLRERELAAIRRFLKDAEGMPSWIGKAIPDLSELPAPVQQYINQIKS